MAAAKEAIWLPAKDFYDPGTGTAPAALAVRHPGTDATKAQLQVRAFDATAAEYLWTTFVFPERLEAAGTVSYQVVWAHEGGQTGGLDDVVWQVGAYSLTENASFDQTLTFDDVTDQGVAADTIFETAITTLAVDGTELGGNTVAIRVNRNPADGADDMDIDADFIGLRIWYTSEKQNDNF